MVGGPKRSKPRPSLHRWGCKGTPPNLNVPAIEKTKRKSATILLPIPVYYPACAV